MNAIVGMMLKEGEMYRLKEKIEFDFESQKWKVPPFIIKAKEVSFPTIKNAKNFVKEELNQRDVVLADTGEVLSAGSSGSGNKYGRNGIQDTFKTGQAANSNSRQRKRVNQNASNAFKASSLDSAGEHLKVTSPTPPFRNGGSINGFRNANSLEESNRFNNDYYASN